MVSQNTPPKVHYGIRHLGFTVETGKSSGFLLSYGPKEEQGTEVFLYLRGKENRIKVSGLTRLEQEKEILFGIDDLKLWGKELRPYFSIERNGKIVREGECAEPYTCHVKPIHSKFLSIGVIAAEGSSLTYPTENLDGKVKPAGRLLYNVGEKWYFRLSKLAVKDRHRGFDCTSFPMALWSIPKLDGLGYGSQLSDALGATKCGYEKITCATLMEHFKKKTIPEGIYVVFNAGHVLLYNRDINILYEFTRNEKRLVCGFVETPAELRIMQKALSNEDQWWVRKLPEGKRPQFPLKQINRST